MAERQAGWFLPLDAVNDLQARTIQRTIDRAKHAHHTDVDMRINGKNEYFEADWIKHMVRLEAPNLPPLPRPAHTHHETGLNNGWTWTSYSAQQMCEYAAAVLAAHGVTACVTPKNDDDALLIDNLFRACLGRDSDAIDRARMALRQRMNELRTHGVLGMEEPKND